MVPAVAGLKREGASKGACLSFLISTPETGVDSIAVTYSLLDPIMTVMRPVTAFVTAFVGGVVENVWSGAIKEETRVVADQEAPVDAWCEGTDCCSRIHSRQGTFLEKVREGVRFAADDLMHDLAGWFLVGILLAGVITVMMPESVFEHFPGSGIVTYLALLVVSLPMYVCATMSTPIAAALVLKGMSPGAALVLLVAGPATNMATITMVGGLLGGRTLGIYLSTIVICTLVMAFVTDMCYEVLGVSARATAGKAASELVPAWLELGVAVVLAALFARVLFHKARAYLAKRTADPVQPSDSVRAGTCGCERDLSHGP